jgi:PAP2 superfamily protein
MRTRFTALVLPLILLAGCSEQPIAPTNTAVGTSTALVGGAPKFWETGATVAWNELADRLLARRFPTPALVHTYLALAQFKAAEATAASTRLHPPISAAIGGASVAVLSVYFPLDVADLEAALDAQEAADPWPGDKHENFAAGEAIGRAIGARVIIFRQSDRVGLADPGPAPVGPGSWIPNGPPAKGTLGARPFYLSAPDEVRPPAPPAFGSPEFNAALAEIRQISDTRTPEQTAIAVYWHVNQGPFSAAAWNGIVRDLIVSHHKSDADAARIFFLGYSAVWDGLLGVAYGKFHYWVIRPSQADPGITLPISLPNHPSYPSNHAAIEGAWAGILEAAFPDQVERLEQIAEEGAISRLYGGIHYRFDKDAGMALGRAAAARALAADLSQVAPLP